MQRSFATSRMIRRSSAFRARPLNDLASFSKPPASKRAFATTMMDIKNSVQSGTATCSPLRIVIARINRAHYPGRMRPVSLVEKTSAGASPPWLGFVRFRHPSRGQKQPRQRQSQHGPQTDDGEIGGCSCAGTRYAERGQELTLIFSYGSHCDVLRYICVRGRQRWVAVRCSTRSTMLGWRQPRFEPVLILP